MNKAPYRNQRLYLSLSEEYLFLVLRELNGIRRKYSGTKSDGNKKEYVLKHKHRLTFFHRVTQYDIWRFRKESGLQAWQTKELRELSDLIQHRIHALQNPPNCTSARKILCNYPITMVGTVGFKIVDYWSYIVNTYICISTYVCDYIYIYMFI